MKQLTKILFAACALTASALTHAVPINNWDVTVDGSWSSFGPAGVTRVGDQLRWGTSTGLGQSTLTIVDPAVTNIPTWFGGGIPPAGYTAPSVTLIHDNNPITGTSLTNATLSVALTLKPTNPAFPSFPADTINYQIRFVETPNSGTCAIPGSPTPCNDIFVQLGGFLNDSFSYEGQTYFVNAFPTSGGVLNTLPTTACTAAGLGAGCFGFSTPENQATTLAFGLTISSERLSVPEPGSLALIGLALAGLGFVSRRRSAAATVSAG